MIVPEKTVTFLSFIISSETMTIKIPEKKINKLKRKIE